MNTNNPTASTETDPDFLPIDGPDTGLPSFVLAMLRTAQIETAKDYERREITSETISRWMKKHRNLIPTTYRPKEIREQLWRYGGEIRGGGVKIEWSELPEEHYGSARHYHFTFTKLFKTEQMVGELA